MRTINEIATWFKENNILALNDDLRVKVLSLYTKVAYTVSNKELLCEELNLEDNDLNIGITDMKVSAEFDREELQILNTMNHVYGCDELKYLILPLTGIKTPNLKEITECLKDDILFDLESFQNYSFNEYVLLLGDNVFFVDDKTVLTEEEKERLSLYNDPEQDSFVVFRNEADGMLVVY